MKLPEEFWILLGWALFILAICGGMALMKWAGAS